MRIAVLADIHGNCAALETVVTDLKEAAPDLGLPGYQADEPYPHLVEAGAPHARYLIMDRTPAGWRFDFRALVYDWDRAAAFARSRGREDWARVLATGFLT